MPAIRSDRQSLVSCVLRGSQRLCRSQDLHVLLLLVPSVSAAYSSEGPASDSATDGLSLNSVVRQGEMSGTTVGLIVRHYCCQNVPALQSVNESGHALSFWAQPVSSITTGDSALMLCGVFAAI